MTNRDLYLALASVRDASSPTGSRNHPSQADVTVNRGSRGARPRGSRHAPPENRTPRGHGPSRVGYGDCASGPPLEFATTAPRNTLWLPDGRRLAYTALVPARNAVPVPDNNEGFGHDFRLWSRVPVIHILHTATVKAQLLHVGWNPVVSTDGKSLLASDYAGRWRLVDTASGRSRPVSAPGVMGYPIGLLDSRIAIYPALPTSGTRIKWTKNNSPLVGKKLMLSI